MRRAERLGAGSGPGRDSPGKRRGVGQVSTPVGRRGSGATRIGAGSRRGPLGVRCEGGAGRGGVVGGSALRGWEGGADGLRKAEGRNRIWGDGGVQRAAGDGRERLGEVGAGGQPREAQWGGGARRRPDLPQFWARGDWSSLGSPLPFPLPMRKLRPRTPCSLPLPTCLPARSGSSWPGATSQTRALQL